MSTVLYNNELFLLKALKCQYKLDICKIYREIHSPEQYLSKRALQICNMLYGASKLRLLQIAGLVSTTCLQLHRFGKKFALKLAIFWKFELV